MDPKYADGHHDSDVAANGRAQTTPCDGASPKGRTRSAFFWPVSGGALLAAVGFLGPTVYEECTSSFKELRTDLRHFNTTCGDLIKKEEFHGRMNSVWSSIKELHAANAAAAAREEHVKLLEGQIKSGEEERKELTRELQRLRERLAALEGRQAVTTTAATMHPAAN